MSFKNLARLFACAMLMLAFQGCEIYSLEPYYLNRDVTFDKGILGKWLQKTEEGKSEYLFENADANQYRVTIQAPKEASKKYRMTLFKISDVLLADVMPDPSDLKDQNLIYPIHLLMKVSQTKDGIHFSYISDDWLEGLADRESFSGDYFDAEYRRVDGKPLFVCTTFKLQKFLTQAAKTPEAWSQKDQIVLARDLK